MASNTTAPINNTINSGTVNNAANQNQQSIQQQQAFLNALQGQNGLANQSSIYNQQQTLANQLAGSNVVANQNALAGQLQAQAAGQGPNPAAAQLAQQTSANTQNQAALMAGQRGAGSNAGLIARQAAAQGAANQQNAIGQSAVMQAQQQLAAQNQLQSLYGTQLGAQQNQQGQLANMANTQIGQQQQAVAQLGQQTAQNQATINQANEAQNQVNAGLQAQNTQATNSLLGGVLGAVGSAATMAAGVPTKMASGGEVESPDDSSDDIQPKTTAQTITNAAGAGLQSLGAAIAGQKAPSFTTHADGSQQSSIFKHLTGASNPPATAADATPPPSSTPGSPSALGNYGTPAQGGNIFGVATKFAKGGKVPALVSPGERYLPPSDVKKVAEGKKSPMKAGEKIPGKAKVGGAKNSYANDTVPKTLEEGGVVLPRSVTQSKNPSNSAHKFIAALIAKHGLPKGIK